jgi:uncharacterized RDD family membrane protein YckC
MEEILDLPDQPMFDQNEARKVKYAGFWPRFGALFVDGIILAPITFGVTYLNISSTKSSLLLLLMTLVSIGYKPFLEYMYGATWGKMALKLKVTNADFEKAELKEILLRNVFNIIPALITLLYTLAVVYSNPDFESVSGWMDYTRFLQQFKVLQYINYISGSISIIDGIMLIADDQKRSLHDRIAKTFVIEQS